MRVLGVLAAWGVLAVLATMCFALGGSIGYRRGVKDTLAQVRDRRTGKAGCRPLPANHMRRRSSGHARPGARARRSRWQVPHVTTPHRRSRVPIDPRITVAAASVVGLMILGIPATAVAATTAQPGDSLYGVKRGLEQVRLAVAVGPERDAEVHVDLAAARLAELTGLVGDEVPASLIADVSEDLEAHAAAASEQLDEAPDSADQTQLQRRLAAVATQQAETIDLALEGCADTDAECEALEQTRDDTVALSQATDSDVPTVVAGELIPPETTVAQADAQADAEASAAPAEVDAAGATGATTDDVAAAVADAAPSETAGGDVPVASGDDGSTAEGPAAEAPLDAPTPAASASPGASEAPSDGSTRSPTPRPSPSPSSGPSPSSAEQPAPRDDQSASPARKGDDETSAAPAARASNEAQDEG